MYVFCPQIIRTSEIFKFSIEDHENDLFVYNYVYITFLNRQKKLFSDDSYHINPNGEDLLPLPSWE